MVEYILITNRDRDVGVAAEAGIHRIMIDLERTTKLCRQAGRGTFVSEHSIDDIARIRRNFPEVYVVVRINSIHAGTHDEIRRVSECAPAAIMLPFFRELREVDKFLSELPEGIKPILLLENVASLRLVPTLIQRYANAIAEYYVGLNDLSLDLGNCNFLLTLEDSLLQKTIGLLTQPWGIGGTGDPFNESLPISPRGFFQYQVAKGATRTLLSRSFRTLFDLERPGPRIASAIDELDSLARQVLDLPTDAREIFCERFLASQYSNRSFEMYRINAEACHSSGSQ
jgi:hypothetical protein